MSIGEPDIAVRRLILLGCTGSIGRNTIEVVEHLHRCSDHRFEIVGLAAGRNAEVLADQARRLGVASVALADDAQADRLAGLSGVHVGPGAATAMIESIARPGDLVVGAMVGSVGVSPTISAIERGCDIALANKETLVAAGEIVVPLARRKGVRLLPIDSEHSAIFQCLLAGRSIDEVARLVITASGGPFREWPRERMAEATIEEALNHPTWTMGPKITIDSATMMNKALEIIEAHWLFGLGADRIDAIVHPQSIIHSFVEFIDGSVLAQLGPPDMKTPIQYALTWPHRAAASGRTVDWTRFAAMHFESVDRDRFGSIDLAYRVIEAGGSAGAILNGANEAAVAAFLAGHISFGSITDLARDALDTIPPTPVTTMHDVLTADQAARIFVHDRLRTGPPATSPGDPAYSSESR